MKCGRKLPDEAKFCLYCGTAVTPIQYAEPSVPAGEEAAPAPEPEPPETPEAQAGPATPEIDVPAPEPETLEAQPESVAPEPSQKPGRRLPKWVPFAGGGVLLVLLIVALILIFPRNRDEEPAAAGTPVISAAVAEPTAEPGTIDYSDLELPDLSEGESLYVGEMSFEQTDRAVMAFILSADGSEIHDLTIRLENLQLDLPETVSISGLTVTETYNTSFDRYSDPLWFGPSMLTELYINKDVAFVVLDYVYTYTSVGGDASFTEFPLGTVSVELTRVAGGEPAAADASASDATEPDAAEPASSGPSETATVQFEDTEYVLSIGEFGTDEDGNQTITVNSTGIGAVLSFRDGSLVIPVHMKCLCGDSYIYSKGITISRNALVFAFNADIEPEMLILYPDGADDDPTQWAVYSIEQGGFLSDY